MPDHALGVIGSKPRPGDVTVSAGGVVRVLAEAVGPAIHPVGEIGRHTATYRHQIEIRIVED